MYVDDMPPLVDNPNPSMTFTFFTDMTPITAFTADPTLAYANNNADEYANNRPSSYPRFSFYDPQPYAGRQTHAKKRDASYIPRPPNAFILFRSSFIRSQQVPEKVEGNHSTLSKIIGKYWKTLPRSEREVWEAKALLAQAEHRRRYPDWRFRPGANALVKAKMKVKDGPGTGKNKDKGGGRSGSNIKGERGKDNERCALIAGLLVEGKKGRALQDAVEKWEAEGISVNLEVDGQFGMKEDEGGAKKDKRAWEINKRIGDGCNGDLERDRECGTKRVADLVGKVGMKKSVDKNDATVGGAHGDTDAPIRDHIPTCMDTPIDTRFKVPLTAMFKRSVSAPVPVSGAGALGANASEDAPSPSINYASPPSLLHSRQDSFGSVISDDTTASNSPVTPTDDYESEPNRGSYEYGTLSPLMLPGSTEYIITSENSGFGANRKSSPNPGSNAKRSPALIAYSPSMSPLASAFGTYGYSPDMGYGKGINGYEHDYTQAQDETGTYSSYSTLQGWNSVEMSNFGESNDNCHSNTGCFSSIDMVDSGLVYGSAMPVMYEWSSVTDTMNTRDITRPQTGRRNEDTFSGDAGWA
ncbi:hypothetical protein BJ138DRAFT_1017577 [Hygrophoropsis aurantiaca]|uniref:Uncharacterized protein n=1 Tax=Hygrophoropsis aurantiaca TaxID=72124 RepID=A0ACB7ZY04_9AGAM|nr:hypothetical protein BJ138DRAFT_1017577 [Hygrophoropsis aurantiaca]